MVRWSFETGKLAGSPYKGQHLNPSASPVLKVIASPQIKGCDFIPKLVCDVRL